MIVSIPKELLKRLEAAAAASAPEEACGLLLGEEGAFTIADCVVTHNVTQKDKASHFEVDPSIHMKLQRQAREGGPDIIGVWHSHPNGVAELSATDRRQSTELNWIWLVTALRAGLCKTAVYAASPTDSHTFTAAELVIA